jgi:hypothetical protein
MLAKGMKGKAKIHAREQDTSSKMYRPNKSRAAQHKLICLLQSCLVLPDKDEEDLDDKKQVMIRKLRRNKQGHSSNKI